MFIKTKRFEFEISRHDLYLRVAAFGWTFATFRDFSGQGLSTTDWTRKTESDAMTKA
ncbi:MULTISPECIES: hypothetical protein [Rhizobium]|uniref:Uncharacterized protein n=1 Tax=Rhizobium paranaense TaxID=1650438 RepID=A0A7W9D3P6_9HYPH|nr:hypothetical protein [Rhizobium paranaense]MBB5576694.1 hypothetical protein [Rhizobium paranaense]